MLAVGLGSIVALVAVLHRNSGDVGAAADLVEARAEIAARTGEGEDPFAAVDRGTFAAVRRIEHDQLGEEVPEALDAVELGAYGDGTPALRILSVGPLDGLTASGAVQLELRSGPNGLVVRWPAGTTGGGGERELADLIDLRSGTSYDDPTVELASDDLIIPLPAVFTAERSWSVTAALAPKQAPPPSD